MSFCFKLKTRAFTMSAETLWCVYFYVFVNVAKTCYQKAGVMWWCLQRHASPDSFFSAARTIHVSRNILLETYMSVQQISVSLETCMSLLVVSMLLETYFIIHDKPYAKSPDFIQHIHYLNKRASWLKGYKEKKM